MSADKTSTLYRFQERLRIARQGGKKVDVSFLLDAAAEAQTTEDFVRWLEQVIVWLRVSGGSGVSTQGSLKFLLSRIAQNAQWSKSVASLLQQLLSKGSYVHLFSDTGVHSNYDFFRESVDRLVKGFFPAYGNFSELDIAISRIFNREDDAAWVTELTPELRAHLSGLIFASPQILQDVKNHLMGDISEACSFLCVRLSAVCIQREIMERAGKSRVIQIPPLRLRTHIESYFAELLSGRDRAELEISYELIKTEIAYSRKYLDDVRSHLEHFGVSVGIVFSLETGNSILSRIETLLKFSRWLCFAEGEFDSWGFLADFIRSTHEEKQILPLLKSNFHLLSKKIVEKTGATGEDYITGNREEYFT
ncbi:MAG: hypothetical protein ACXVBE_13225, partial [Bdellovibrionota bacterium]